MDAHRFENFSLVPADPLQHAAATVGSWYYCTMMVYSYSLLFSFAVECSHSVITWGTERSAWKGTREREIWIDMDDSV